MKQVSPDYIIAYNNGLWDKDTETP